jgi:hypothetical protein
VWVGGWACGVGEGDGEDEDEGEGADEGADEGEGVERSITLAHPQPHPILSFLYSCSSLYLDTGHTSPSLQ